MKNIDDVVTFHDLFQKGQQQEWFRGDTNQCNAIKEETLLGIFIGLAVIAFVIVILIIVNLIVLLKRTKIAKSQKKVGIKSKHRYLPKL